METAGHRSDPPPPRDPEPGRLIPAHLLPVPATVSPEMQQVIAAPYGDWVFAKPRNVAEWRQLIDGYDRQAAADSRAIRDALQVSAEEISVNGRRCHRVVPHDVAPGHDRRLLVHTHGGAYVFGTGEAGLSEAALVAHFTKSPVLSVDYRMPPEHPFPAAVEDAVAVWQAMLESHDRRNAAMFGSSAGGGLTMAVVLRLKQLGVALPAALFLGSPWANLAKIADSQFANDRTDNLMVTYDGVLAESAKLYANHHSLDEPLLSPLGGDLSGFPPSIITSGTRDLFLSLAVLTHRKLRASGVEAELHVFEAVSHIQFLAFPAPECATAMTEVARFFDRYLAQ